MNSKRLLHLFIITFVIVISGFYSCERNYPLPKEMSIAKEIMLKRPDSALKILEEFKNIDDLPVQLRATYNLLLIEARDKNYVVHTSDSLINTVVNYFEHSDDPVMKAKAYFYQGRVNKDMQQVEKAALCFKKAETVANGTKEYRLQALICNEMGILSLYQNLLNDAVTWHEKAYKAILLSGDSNSVSYVLRDLGRVNVILKDYDKALSLYREAFDAAEKNKQQGIAAGILYEIGWQYDLREISDSTIIYMSEAFKMDPTLLQQEQSCLGLAEAYRKDNKLDSARFYRRRCW